MLRHAALFFAICAAATGCGSRPSAAAHGDTVAETAGGTVVADPPAPYVATTFARVGSVAGTVPLAGITMAQSSAPCIGGARPSRDPNDTSPVGVVWIDSLRRGKPLPEERRYELESVNCAIEPRVETALVGAAINVINDDPTHHRLVFIRAGTHDTLQVMPFSEAREMVATDRLTRTTGIIEIHCALHPSTIAYLLVFDHPYTAVTSHDGRYTLDSVPVGTHRLMIWKPGDAVPQAQTVTVQTNSPPA